MRDLQLGGRVAVDRHGDVHLAVDVVQHGLDGGGQAGEEQVLDVPAGPRPQQHPAALGDRDVPPTSTESVSGSTEASAPGSHQGSRPWRTPASARGYRGSQTSAAAVRIAPCRRSRISGGMRVDRVDDGRGPRVGGPGLRLLLVGEHQRAQA